MLARAESLYRKRSVKLVGNGNSHKINLGVGKHRLIRGVGINAVFACELGAFRLYIVNSGKISHIAFKQMAGVPATHSAVTDNGTAFFTVGFLICKRHVSIPFDKWRRKFGFSP